MTKKEIIAVDIDDVLATNAEGFVEFSNKRWGTNLVPSDYHDHWAELWGVENHEAVARADVLVKDGVFRSYNHLEDALPVLSKLSKRFDLVVVNFKGLFKEVYFAGIWDEITNHSAQKGKGDLLKEIGAHYLIDDQIKHCKTAAEHDIEALLFGNYSWNRAEDLPAGVHRVSNWRGVAEFFDAR
ncbi:hypothetical protein HY004_01225 [Candidatus Saccharibacteria bacterium]|nr:hypothetical protein [Candidatus Saccharibacteria bacterium]